MWKSAKESLVVPFFFFCGLVSFFAAAAPSVGKSSSLVRGASSLRLAEGTKDLVLAASSSLSFSSCSLCLASSASSSSTYKAHCCVSGRSPVASRSLCSPSAQYLGSPASPFLAIILLLQLYQTWHTCRLAAVKAQGLLHPCFTKDFHPGKRTLLPLGKPAQAKSGSDVTACNHNTSSMSTAAAKAAAAVAHQTSLKLQHSRSARAAWHLPHVRHYFHPLGHSQFKVKRHLHFPRSGASRRWWLPAGLVFRKVTRPRPHTT